MLRFYAAITLISLLALPICAAPRRERARKNALASKFPPVFVSAKAQGERLEIARCGTKWRLLYQVNRARPVADLPDSVEAEVRLPDGIWSASFALRSWTSEVAVVLEKRRRLEEPSLFDALNLKGNAAAITYYRIGEGAIVTPFPLVRVRSQGFKRTSLTGIRLAS